LLEPPLPSPHPALDNEQPDDFPIATGPNQILRIERLLEQLAIHKLGLCQCAFQQMRAQEGRTSGESLPEETGEGPLAASFDQRSGQPVGIGRPRHRPVTPSLRQGHEGLTQHIFNDRLRKQRMNDAHLLRAAAWTKSIAVAGDRLDLHALASRHALKRACPGGRSGMAGMEAEAVLRRGRRRHRHRGKIGRDRDPPDIGLTPARKTLQPFEAQHFATLPTVSHDERRWMLEEQGVAATSRK